MVSVWLARILVGLIQVYQRLRPGWWQACRFHPTCSVYAIQAITIYGPVRGVLKATWRLLRCQPFCAGGMDPV